MYYVTLDYDCHPDRIMRRLKNWNLPLPQKHEPHYRLVWEFTDDEKAQRLETRLLRAFDSDAVGHYMTRD
jgi:hypothetical protein